MVVVFLAALTLDLAATGVCCSDTAQGSSPVSVVEAVSNSAAATHSISHLDDDCFCCARSLATPIYAFASLQSCTFEMSDWREAPSLTELSPPYHPPHAPQLRS